MRNRDIDYYEKKYTLISLTLITPLVVLEIQRKRITQRKGIKILSLKQMLQRLQVPAGNTFQNLMNEIRQISYSNQVYNNNLIK